MIRFKFNDLNYWNGNSFLSDDEFLNKVCNYLLNDQRLLRKCPGVAIYLYQLDQIDVSFYVNGLKLILDKNNASEIHISARQHPAYISIWIGYNGNIVYTNELSVKYIEEYEKS